MDARVFVFSSLNALPDRFFMGQTFVGHDLIVGHRGGEQFLKATGKYIQPGEDGCYATVEKRNGQHTIGADFCGYTKLFVYNSGATWAVSNSFLELVHFAKTHNLPLTVDLGQLEAWNIDSSFGRQLTSHKTLANEISLLPSSKYLVVKDGNLSSRERPKRQRPAYGNALTQFLSRWTGRAATIASDNNLQAVVDLTGGLDSRAVAAIFVYVSREFERPNITFRSSVDLKEDLAVAQMLAGKYSLPLNCNREAGLVLACPDPYHRWKSLCVGAYAPIYFPPRHINPNQIAFGGGGGESHRPFYRSNSPYISPEEFLEGHKKYFRSDQQYSSWRDSVLETILKGGRVSPNYLIHHYREFRNRFHAARIGTYRTHFAPLASRYLFDCSDAYGAPDPATKQLFYDLMQNLCPGLVAEGYANTKNTPSQSNIDSVTLAEFETEPGRVFGTLPTARESESESIPPGQLLIRDFSMSLRRMPENLLQDRIIAKAAAKIAAFQEAGDFESAHTASPIHQVILAGEISQFLPTNFVHLPSVETEPQTQAKLRQTQAKLRQTQAKRRQTQEKLREKQATLREKQAKLREKQAKLSERQAKLRQTKAKLRQTQAKLDNIETSRSWRTLKTLRKLAGGIPGKPRAKQ